MRALTWLVVAGAAPLLALVFALRLAGTDAAPAARRVALLAVAAPPILVLYSSLRGSLPLLGPWLVFWVLLALIAVAVGRGGMQRARPAVAGSLTARRVHMNAIIGVGILLYLLFHVANQLSGWFGAATYDEVMKFGRSVYRAAYIEPILVTLIFLQILSALHLFWRDAAAPQDRFRTLQIASGCYLVFFLLSHLNATLVFGRIFLHGNTGFAFATGGPGGLLRSEQLIVYYGLAVFFALLHVALGVRRALLVRGVRRQRADRVVVVSGALSALLALVIIAGLACSSSLAHV